MASPVLSFRLDEEIVSKLDKLAEATDRDRLYHVKRAMACYLEVESWHLQATDHIDLLCEFLGCELGDLLKRMPE